MGNQLRLVLMGLGALIVLATFTYPSWRTPPEVDVTTDDLPGLDPELQAAFLELPRPIQTSYRLLSEQNAALALTMVEARLTPPEPAVEPPPATGNAQLVGEGEFGPVPVAITDDRQLPRFVPVDLDEDDNRSQPPFANLHPSSGTVRLWRYPDDRVAIRLEGLNVVNGPDLWLAVVPMSNPLTPDDFGPEHIEIAELRSNTGNLTYELTLPDVAIYESVVIYDRRLGVVYAVAPIT